jgi:hypothetical protein
LIKDYPPFSFAFEDWQLLLSCSKPSVEEMRDPQLMELTVILGFLQEVFVMMTILAWLDVASSPNVALVLDAGRYSALFTWMSVILWGVLERRSESLTGVVLSSVHMPAFFGLSLGWAPGIYLTIRLLHG